MGTGAPRSGLRPVGCQQRKTRLERRLRSVAGQDGGLSRLQANGVLSPAPVVFERETHQARAHGDHRGVARRVLPPVREAQPSGLGARELYVGEVAVGEVVPKGISVARLAMRDDAREPRGVRSPRRPRGPAHAGEQHIDPDGEGQQEGGRAKESKGAVTSRPGHRLELSRLRSTSAP